MNSIVDYLVVLLLGAFIGFIEILSRYKDAPFKVSFSPPGMFYILINALVSAIALWIVRLFGWTFSENPQVSAEITRWTQVIVAGLASMTVFRSSLFVFRFGDQDVSVGPNAILQILLNSVDKEVDRWRGQQRAKVVEAVMEGISFEDAALNLPTVSIALMQNLSATDQDRILKKVEWLLKSDEGKLLPEDVKTISLGLEIVNVVGEDVLKAAIDMVNLERNRNQGKGVSNLSGQPGAILQESESSLREKVKGYVQAEKGMPNLKPSESGDLDKNP